MAVKEARGGAPALSVAADRSAAATLSAAMTMPATRRRERQRRSMQARRLLGVLSRERDPGWQRGAGASAAQPPTLPGTTSRSRQFELVLF
jgi:hypothetical protein